MKKRTKKEMQEIVKEAKKLLKTKSVTETAEILNMSRVNLIATYIIPFGLEYRKIRRTK
jgi:hypothetical protein